MKLQPPAKPKRLCEAATQAKLILTSWMFPIVKSVTRHRRHSVHAFDAM